MIKGFGVMFKRVLWRDVVMGSKAVVKDCRGSLGTAFPWGMRKAYLKPALTCTLGMLLVCSLCPCLVQHITQPGSTLRLCLSLKAQGWCTFFKQDKGCWFWRRWDAPGCNLRDLGREVWSGAQTEWGKCGEATKGEQNVLNKCWCWTIYWTEPPSGQTFHWE